MVPVLLGIPILAYHSPPFKTMCDRLERVSTLFITVGFLYNPTAAGNGGLSLGLALFPSTDSINEVSSPQT